MHFGAVREFQGLNFTTDVRTSTNIAALVGRNGAGKTRLLKGVAEGHIEVFVNDAVVPSGSARLMALNDLQPGIVSSFDVVQHREQQRQAIALYNTHKGKWHIDPQQSIAATNSQFGRHTSMIHAPQLAHVVSHASTVLGKDPNQLADGDIGDFVFSGDFMALGSVNVSGTMRAYLDRLDENEFNEFRNFKYGEQRPFWTPDELQTRFGPPPWETLNEFLRMVLDGRYEFEVPDRSNPAGYNGSLYRTSDGRIIDPSWLSSGEKVLMWLCLSMYATSTGRVTQVPKLLLLDEPDGVLHPHMVQKLHMVLKIIADRFNCGVLFTTHSPTSVALFNNGPIWQVGERTVVDIDKDTAINDLLVGLDQVSIHYTTSKQVYVESHNDQDIYSELFAYLRRWNKGVSEHIALTFIPAAPKLAEKNVRDLIASHLTNVDAGQADAFIQALNGQGDCAQVEGAVESLNVDNAVPVHGIIDWDRKKQPKQRLHVLAESLFYSIENAVLNPLTLGLYLLHNFPAHLESANYGLPAGFDCIALYTEATHWQSIADGVTKRVLGLQDVSHDLACSFLSGSTVSFDKRYVHMNGHDLEVRIRQGHAYPFLNRFNRRPTLLMDVVQRGIQPSQGRTMPSAFADIFLSIQRAQ